MTNLEALKGKVGFPLKANTYLVALEDRSLSSTDTYVAGNKRALELAQADVLMSAVTSPQSVSEGGYSISMGERATLLALATSIYKRYGDAGALNTPTPTATWIRQ